MLAMAALALIAQPRRRALLRHANPDSPEGQFIELIGLQSTKRKAGTGGAVHAALSKASGCIVGV